jgi:acetyl/propionyl-CoA carboxylase alpha subunit
MENLNPQMNRAISEALNAFGDGAVLLKKYVGSPRHIEIQILADSHGIFYIYSKESVVFNVAIKRSDRRGAIFGINAGMRKKMGEAAVGC